MPPVSTLFGARGSPRGPAAAQPPGRNFAGVGHRLRRGVDFRVTLPAWLLTLTLAFVVLALVMLGMSIHAYLPAGTQGDLTRGSHIQQPSSNSIITTVTVTTTATAATTQSVASCNVLPEDEEVIRKKNKKRQAEEDRMAAAVREGCLLEARAAELWDKPWGSANLEDFHNSYGNLAGPQPHSQTQRSSSAPPSWHNHNHNHHKQHHGRDHGRDHGDAASKEAAAQSAREKRMCKACLLEEGDEEHGSIRRQPLLERIGSYLGDAQASAVYRRVFLRQGSERAGMSGEERQKYVEGVCQHIWRK